MRPPPYENILSRRYLIKLTNVTLPRLFRAAAVEEELRDIANQQQVNVDKLVELVKENEIILQKMRVSIGPRDDIVFAGYLIPFETG